MFIIELKEGGNWQIRDASDRFSDNDRRGQEASRPVREGFSPLPLQPLLSSARDLHGRERRDGTPVTRLRGIESIRCRAVGVCTYRARLAARAAGATTCSTTNLNQFKIG